MLVCVARAVLTIMYKICPFKPNEHACFISRTSQFPILGVMRVFFIFFFQILIEDSVSKTVKILIRHHIITPGRR